jgi:prolyl-tRNA editing enzyme YbaK/EbsC (Cys-tRNA(Pro) deacylase)
MGSSTDRVQAALEQLGIAARVTELADSTRTARDAADTLGCGVAQIAKSLMFRRTDTDQPVLVIASGTNRVDEARIGAHLQAPVALADADFVRAASGFAIGGVPPVGHAGMDAILIDEDLLAFDRVWAAAGTPRAVFPIEPRELVRATGGEVTRVAAAVP